MASKSRPAWNIRLMLLNAADATLRLADMVTGSNTTQRP